MLRIAVQFFLGNRARAIATGVVVAFGSVSSAYGQSNSSWGASPTYVTGANVGIGTNNPAAPMDIETTNAGTTLKLGSTGQSHLVMDAPGGADYFDLYSSGSIRYQLGLDNSAGAGSNLFLR